MAFGWLTVYDAAIGLAALSILLLIRQWVVERAYPSAPGPKAARLTKLWYLFKVWQGSFEKWNIQQHANHGKVLRVAPGMYSIIDPEATQAIYGLGSKMTKTSWYTSWGNLNIKDHNLFSARDRQFHAGMRKKVAHLYSMTAIKEYEPYVNNCIALLLEQLDRLAKDGETFNLQHWMQCYAFDVIGEITFGSRLGFIESGGKDVGNVMHNIENANSFFTLFGISHLFAPIYLLMYGNPVKGLLEWLSNGTKMRARLGVTEKSENQVADFGTKLDALKAKNPEEYEYWHIETNMGANVAAGSDTTSISLTAIMYFIAKYPLVYKKLRAEILEAERKGQADDPITFDQAQKLPYFAFVMKEALRMHSATGLPMWRTVQEPGIKLAGKFFPAGAIVGVNNWVAHYDPTVFGPDPNTFRPERWSESPPDQLKAMEHYYMPFGLGTRTCVGKNISILEMTKVVPELVKRYDFELLGKEMRSKNHWFVKQMGLEARISRAGGHM